MLEQKNWQAAEYALYNINACLTEDYLIELNTEEYQKETKESVLYECPFCKGYTPLPETHFHKRLLPVLESVILGTDYLECWFCTQCKESVPRTGATIIREKRAFPSYQRFMYEKPGMRSGLMYRQLYIPEFKKWFWKFLELLQHQLARYRVEYIAQNGEDMQDVGFPDKGDKVLAYNN